jgi:ATP-binding cassette subfamily B protein
VPVFGRKGASRHVREVIRALIRTGAQVELFATRCEGQAPSDLESLPIHPLTQIPKWTPAAREKLAVAANRGLQLALRQASSFDLIYERYSLWSYGAIAHAKANGVPSLLEVNAPLIEEQSKYRDLINRPTAERIANYVFTQASELLAVSNGVAGYLESFPINSNNIHIVPNGVDPDRFRPDVAPAIAKEHGTFTVGFVGTLKPWHGLDMLIKAFELLHRSNSMARLLIVGDGPMRGELEAEITKRSLEDAVKLVGSVYPGEVPSWLTSMDVAVAPYSQSEDFYFCPLKVYEYMAAGLPVVSSRVGQLESLVYQGVTGLLCQPGNPRELAASLNYLQNNPELQTRFGQAGRERILRYHTWDVVATRIIELAGIKPRRKRVSLNGHRKKKSKAPRNFKESLPRFLAVIQRFGPHIKREWPLLSGALIALIAQIGLRLLEPWPLKIVIDEITGSEASADSSQLTIFDDIGPVTLITLAALAIVVIAIARAVTAYFSTVGLALAGNRIISQVRNDLYKHMLRLPLSFHIAARQGDLITRVTGDVGRLREVTVTAVMPLIVHTLTLVGMLALMFWLNWQLGLLALAAFPLLALVMFKLSRRIQQVARDQRKHESEMATTAAETIGAIQVVKAFSLEMSLEESFSKQNRKSIKEGVKGKRLSARLGRTVDILIAVGTALVLWYGAWLAIRGEITIGSLIVFLSYLKGAFKPTRSLAKYTERLAKATASGERVLDILEISPEIHNDQNLIKAPRFNGKVRFETVYFGYEPGYFVLENIDFEVQAGQSVAFVGPSGSGKSTLTNLLLRFYDPVQGRVTIDDRDIRSYTLDSLRNQITIVLQENVLFALSIKDNIAHGRPDASMNEIEQAARLANAHDFILNLPNGYETVIGERGDTLSGGQRQRIAIARAALSQAQIFILDEPATGLDKENDQLVREALEKVTEGRTVFTIAHDLTAAEEADKIFYLEKGRIVESGGHQELISLRGRYADMYQKQLRQKHQVESDSMYAFAA